MATVELERITPSPERHLLAAADLNRFLKSTAETDETSSIRSFRQWVRKNLAEHRRGGR